jgi:N-acetylneuraminic acid mutarotase
MRKARGGIAAAVVSRGRIVVVGGEEAAGTIRDVELYDPATRRWRSLPPLPTPRHGLGAVSRGNRIWALSGGDQPGFHFTGTVESLRIP